MEAYLQNMPDKAGLSPQQQESTSFDMWGKRKNSSKRVLLTGLAGILREKAGLGGSYIL